MKIKYRDANFKLPDSFYVRQTGRKPIFITRKKQNT